MGILTICLAIACDLNPTNHATLLSACKERVGQLGIDACEILLKLDIPRDMKVEAHLQAGFKLLNLNKCEEAEGHYRSAVLLTGEDPHFFLPLKTCLLGHESYHIDERLRRDPKGCKECHQPDCTSVPGDGAYGEYGSPERLTEECHASLLDVECFKDSGERYEDGTDAEKEAIAKVELCRSHNPPYLP